MEISAERREASVRISKELEWKGYSRHKLEVTSNLVKLREHVENSERGNMPLYNTGSNTEGVDVSGSDRDVMVGFPNVLVLQEPREDSLPKDNHLFVIKQEGTRPCYARLELLREAHRPAEHDLFSFLGGKEELCVKDISSYLLSSDKLTAKLQAYVSSKTESSSEHVVSSFYVHGPCVSFDNTIGRIVFDADFAFCFLCNFVPSEAGDFLQRIKASPWPQKSTVDEYIKNCHVVPVGDKTSNLQTVEWRISYALLERELVWSFNDIQCKCYVLLKMITKQFLDQVAPEMISSYAIKTILFWMAETEPIELWTEENILYCLKRCLCRLLHHVEDMSLPHYIVPSNNILLGKFENAHKHDAAKDVLRDMINWHWSKFLECSALKMLKVAWEEVAHDIKTFLRCTRHPNIGPPFYKDMTSFRVLQSLYIDISTYLSSSENVSGLFQSFRQARVGGIGEEILDFALNALKFKIENSRLFRFEEPVGESKVIYERQSNRDDAHAVTASSPDVCSKMIHKALNYLLDGQLGRSKKAVKELLHSYGAHVMYIGNCGPEETDIIEYTCYVGSSKPLTLRQKVQQLLALDFDVTKHDDLPPVLKTIVEYWDEDSVAVCIHPRVIIYYLYFLTVFQQGKEDSARAVATALSMNVTMTSSKARVWSYVAWNLLGHCFFLMKMYKQAFRAFERSLLTKQTNNPALRYISCC